MIMRTSVKIIVLLILLFPETAQAQIFVRMKLTDSVGSQRTRVYLCPTPYHFRAEFSFELFDDTTKPSNEFGTEVARLFTGVVNSDYTDDYADGNLYPPIFNDSLLYLFPGDTLIIQKGSKRAEVVIFVAIADWAYIGTGKVLRTDEPSVGCIAKESPLGVLIATKKVFLVHRIHQYFLTGIRNQLRTRGYIVN